MKKITTEFYITILIQLLVPAGLIISFFKWLVDMPAYIEILAIIIIVIISVLVSIFLYKRLFGIIIKFDGLEFIKYKIEKYKKTGGKIFTTALFENYDNGDKIRDKIIEINNSFEKKIIFERLVFLDDPTQEFKWIGDFINLNKYNNFNPIIYRVRAEKRTVIRNLIKRLPRFSITAFYSGNKISQVYIGLIAKKNGFGLSTKNPMICKYFFKIIEEYKFNCDPIEEINQIPPFEEFSGGVVNRVIDAIEEYAIEKDYIEYVGVFGGNGLVLQNKLSKGSKCDFEGDLDLIIVGDTQVSFEEFKNEIVGLIDKENIGEFSIEWSNLENKYYETRSPIHIDIQLHRRNDNYYKKSPLIGLSIFDHSLYQVYSKDNKLITEILIIPSIPIDYSERINLVLASKEYGICTARSRLNNNRYFKTDPNRILWISLQNYVWAITGYRIRNKENIYNYISKHKWFEEIGEIKETIKENYYQNSNNKSFNKNTVIKILDLMIKELKLCQK